MGENQFLNVVAPHSSYTLLAIHKATGYLQDPSKWISRSAWGGGISPQFARTNASQPRV